MTPVVYASSSGDDRNDGRTPDRPKRTLPAAWRALPDREAPK